jgi:DNA-binding NarL/FixJ family response regulator
MKIFDLHEGLEVVGDTANGAEALRLSQTLEPDIIMTDVNVPDMDNLETTRQLTASHRMLTVILLTLQGEDLNLQGAYEAGAQVCIAKSDGAEPIIDAVRAEANRRRDQSETQDSTKEI